MRRILSVVALVIAICSSAFALSRSSAPPPSSGDAALLDGSSRKPPLNGWTVVRLSGTPKQIGYQHGYLLAPEIADLQKVFLLELTHDSGRDWTFSVKQPRTSGGRILIRNIATKCRASPRA